MQKAMNKNRCLVFDEGTLPIFHKTIAIFLRKTSILLAFIFLILLPKTSLSTGTKYETAYACEGKTLTLECEPGDLISLIRANYGRFSITICNDHGNVDWSVNCRSSKSLKVLNLKCAHKQNCSVLASTNMFGDPCPGTHKYLEAHYKCISASLTLTTTNRPSPSWLITQQPPPSMHNSNSNNNWITSTLSPSQLVPGSNAPSSLGGDLISTNNPKGIVSVVGVPSSSSSSSSSIPKLPSSGGNSEIHLAGRLPSPTVTTTIKSTTIINKQMNSYNIDVNHILGNHTYVINNNSFKNGRENSNNGNDGNVNYDDGSNNGGKTNLQENAVDNGVNDGDDNEIGTGTGGSNAIASNSFCGPTTSRNLFWNKTRVGDVNVQQCPDGTNGIAKWRCIIIPRSALNNNILQYEFNNLINRNSYFQKKFNYFNNFDGSNSKNIAPSNNIKNQQNLRQTNNDDDLIDNDCDNNNNKYKNGNCDNIKNSINNNINIVNKSSININNNSNIKNSTQTTTIHQQQNSINNDKDYLPMWYPQTPDLTQCRSVWFSNLENDVNKRDSSLVSIANDLSTVTSSKVLYGGDMLVTTKIIQTMSEKMPDDIETFPDQRQRELIISELLTGVVKIGSNLLDKSQQSSWLDLSHEDQMRVATSLLTGLESNAFLLADSIIREKTATYPTKNILLSVRVLDSKNLPLYEVFPNEKNAEHWDISHDRIELPRGALYENSDGGLVRIIFVAFDRLESILRPSYENLDFKIPRNNAQHDPQNMQRVRILNSKVISASLGKGRHIQLSQPIKLVFKHLKTENVTNPTCVFWNYIDHAWSSDGCYLETTNRTHSICMCNHLTNFAILMDVKEEINKSLLSLFDDNLGIFIYISITICIIFIIIAILTLKLFNGAFIKSTRTSIYKNIYVCLFIIEILSLIGVKQNETSLLCGFTTAFLHCFILSAIAWLFFEGFQLYLTLTTDEMLLDVENSSKIIWYYLLSYGLSFTIVAISLAIDPGTYTQSDFCVLMEANALFYSTFMTPIAIFIVGAIICTSLAYYDMCKKNRSPVKTKEHTRLSTIRFDLRCSLLFLIILTADWVSAYLYLRRAKQEEFIAFTYGYLFVIFNSILGVYIFIFHCIQNEKIRREYRKYVRQNSWLPKCLRCSKTSSIASSSSQHHHNSQHHQLSQNQLQQQQQQQQVSCATNIHHAYDSTLVASGNKNSVIIANNNLNCDDDDIDEFVVNSRNDNILTPAGSCSGGGGGGAGTPVTHMTASTPIGKKFLTSDGDIIDQTNTPINGSNITSGFGTLQRNSSGNVTGSIHGNSSVRTPSVGHASPSSSVGSAHLMFNSKLQQQSNDGWNYSQQQQSRQSNLMNDNSKNLNIYDDKLLFYDCKSSKRLKNHQHPTSTTPRNLSSSQHQQPNKRNGSHHGSSIIVSGGNNNMNYNTTAGNAVMLANDNVPYQQHEYFYWTERIHGGAGGSGGSSGNSGQSNNRNKHLYNSNNSNSNDIGKSHNFYPSYKKTRQYSQPQYYQTTGHSIGGGGGSGRFYNKLNNCDSQQQFENDLNYLGGNYNDDGIDGVCGIANSYNSSSSGVDIDGGVGIGGGSSSNNSGGNKYFESNPGSSFFGYPIPNSSALHSTSKINSVDDDHLIGVSSGIGRQQQDDTLSQKNFKLKQQNSNNSIIDNNFSCGGINSPMTQFNSGKFNNDITMSNFHHSQLQQQQQQQHRYDLNISNCDLTNDTKNSQHLINSAIDKNNMLEAYYHNRRHSIDEPVYEEILSSRNSDRIFSDYHPNSSSVCSRNMINDDEDDEDDDDDDLDNEIEAYDHNDDDDDGEDDDDDDVEQKSADRLVPKQHIEQQNRIINSNAGNLNIKTGIAGGRFKGLTTSNLNDEKNEQDCIVNEQQFNRSNRHKKIVSKTTNDEKGRFRFEK